jgi:hypothetical protein
MIDEPLRAEQPRLFTLVRHEDDRARRMLAGEFLRHLEQHDGPEPSSSAPLLIESGRGGRIERA